MKQQHTLGQDVFRGVLEEQGWNTTNKLLKTGNKQLQLAQDVPEIERIHLAPISQRVVTTKSLSDKLRSLEENHGGSTDKLSNLEETTN